jgi:hypothetical protein
VSDVQASWNKDKMVNYLVLRMTPLDVVLNRSVCLLYIYCLVIFLLILCFERLFLLVHLLILDMLNGKLSVESGVNDGCNYENIVFGWLNVIM